MRVISSSPGELEPVFNALLANAVRICAAKFGTLYVREGDGFRAMAIHNAPPAYAEVRKRSSIRPRRTGGPPVHRPAAQRARRIVQNNW
jgi:two-component system NtrC family sensor kinase